MKYLILGVDPGITVGIAALDLDGNLVLLESGKKFGYSKITKILSEVGRPIIITNDVMYAPNLIKKLAATYRAKVILPNRNLKVGEKARLVEEKFGKIKLKDDHQRDALASAIFAYQKFEPLFKKVDSYLEREGLEGNSNLVKKKLILGEARNIKEALKKKEVPEEYKELMFEQVREKKIKRLEEELKKLKETVKKLKEKKSYLEKKLREDRDYIRKSVEKKFVNLLDNKQHTIDELREIISDKENEISNLKKLVKEKNLEIKYILKGYKPVIRLDKPKDILDLSDDYYGYFVILNNYSKFGKKIKEKIEKLNLTLTKGKTFKIGNLEFILEKGDIVEKIEKIIEDWRRRNY